MNFKPIATGAINLIVRRYAGPFWIRRRQLAKSQWFDKNKLQELQLNRLKQIVAHSYNTVPYYKKLMDEYSLHVDSIRTLDDIKLFPVLSKKDVMEAEDSIVSAKYRKWTLRAARTGGTTGTPLVIYRNWFSIGNEHAFVRRQWDWAGIGLRDKCAYLTGRLIVKPDQKNGRLYAYDPIMKELILSTYHLSRRTAEEYAAVIENYDVEAIVGYPSAVYLLARTCLDSGIKLTLKSALTSSETLTKSMKDTITEAFDCRVFDFYGGAERVCYIFTCERGRYHIIPEYGLTELIGIGGPDDNRCSVVATGFWNMAMPLIRYETGDIVIKSDDICPCGRAFPAIESISGRQADVVRTSSGREFGAAILTHLLYGTNNIIESQIIQDTLEHITIEYVPSARFTETDRDNLRSLIVKHLPRELIVDLREVAAVSRTRSGKIKPVVSQITS
jgi:phenylacetate-CoA ligase